ncbi:hypothetical protein HETIRDRAFT_414157 [Heterobasidion irregulare TC 32-1]|uniref:Protein kinase domain-containing protein n=1 Tax=Heterobasidion irregulare (strain TC 32-1) TaxID=747525 RepID=W4KH20_HETIT|nr:uncharacterized protein HETIRDRAFT_414157 [Heterobasidion irregulare TC 32-1]ETW85014.1 hypothetical protein HETIRDRAFT_414157 [Heterobasidion irregulare TC 32-1]
MAPKLPLKVLEIILTQIYLSSVIELEQNSSKTYGSGSKSRHYCSLAHPCSSARPSMSSFGDLRLVCRDWDRAFACVKHAYPFFQDVGDVFYPYSCWIKSRVRTCSISGKYRVSMTLQADWVQGVFLALDYSGSGGCSASRQVVIKVFQRPTPEMVTERMIYNQFRPFERADGIQDGISTMLETGYDPMCGVNFIAMPRLGPSLEHLIKLIPGGRLTPKMVVAVAFQLICRLEELHRRGVVHNGIKPGNICLCSESAAHSTPGTLCIIDFDLSYTLPGPGKIPRHTDLKGNKSFLSLWAHHGITQCQRDDLESLVYLLSYLQRGPLPWERDAQLSYYDEYQPPPHIWQLKALTSAKDLFEDMDEAYMHFFKEVKALAFAEVPNYAALKGLFRDAWTRLVPGEVDVSVNWWDVLRRLLKGESLSSIDAVPSQAEILDLTRLPVSKDIQSMSTSSMTPPDGTEIRTPSKPV